MNDNDMVPVPDVVRAEGWGNGMPVPAHRAYEARRCFEHAEHNRKFKPLTWLWLQTFDQDPVTLPADVLAEGASHDDPCTSLCSNCRHHHNLAYEACGTGPSEASLHQAATPAPPKPAEAPDGGAGEAWRVPDVGRLVSITVGGVTVPIEGYEIRAGDTVSVDIVPGRRTVSGECTIRFHRPTEDGCTSTIPGATMGPGYTPIAVGYDDQSGDDVCGAAGDRSSTDGRGLSDHMGSE